MPDVTEELAKYVKEKGIMVSVISRRTGLSKDKLHKSFSGTRKLRADEFLLICDFLELKPETFMKSSGKQAS